MIRLFLYFSLTFLGVNSRADICADLQIELAVAIQKIPSPGGQMFVTLPDGKSCSASVGQFDVQSGTPLTDSSPLRIWSISKTFTHVGILKLMEAGQLNLDQSLRDFENKFPNLYGGSISHYPKSEKITIRHLLSHTSGIVDYMTLPEFLNKWEQVVSPGELIRVARQHQDELDPGEVSRYSNTAMLILGRIIESVTNTKLEDYLRNTLLIPVDLSRSYIAEQATGWGSIHGYLNNRQGNFVDVTSTVYPSMAWATGSIVSTASDLGKWFRAVLRSEILQPSTASQIFAPVRLNDGSEADYGLGFKVQRFGNGMVMWGHGGGPLAGNSATMIYSPQLQSMVVALTNGASQDANVVLASIGWSRIVRYIRGDK